MLRTCVLLSLVAAACSPRPEPRTPERPENAEGDAPTPEPQASGDDCRGEPTSGTERELVARAEQVQGCYDALIRRDRSRQGRVVVGLRIRPNGEIAAAGLVKDELRDPDFETCALERFSLPFRNPPTGGCLQVQVPIRFAPKPGGT